MKKISYGILAMLFLILTRIHSGEIIMRKEVETIALCGSLASSFFWTDRFLVNGLSTVESFGFRLFLDLFHAVTLNDSVKSSNNQKEDTKKSGPTKGIWKLNAVGSLGSALFWIKMAKDLSHQRGWKKVGSSRVVPRIALDLLIFGLSITKLIASR